MFTRKTIFTIFVFLFVLTCTEETEPKVHPNQWMNSDSYDFHGNQIAFKGLEALETCQTCHGDYYGGGSSQVSCSGCHEGGYSGHPNIYAHLNPDSLEFHGNVVAELGLIGASEECGICHGSELGDGTYYLDGGKVDVSCYTCHAGGPSGHPDPFTFLSPDSAEFHGNGFTQATFDEDVAHCLYCHTIYQIDESDIVSCYQCHQSFPFFE